MTLNQVTNSNQDSVLQDLFEKVHRLEREVSKVIKGQDHLISRLIISLFCQGHVLIEGVPGLAKTLAVRTLAQATGLKFSRIQFTPDLLPADITGTLIYNQHTGKFDVRFGPIFANFILADEINRAPPKVQSALLEAMQEKQVTIGDNTYKLAEPFMVMATQNPLEQEGTYPLPEAQVDRFFMKVIVDYPPREVEREVLRMNLQESLPEIEQVVSEGEIISIRKSILGIYLDRKVEDYILDIIEATRQPEKVYPPAKKWIIYGSSPRGTINLAISARAMAFIKGRDFVVPEDVRDVALDVLRHRIGLSYEAEAEGITPDHVLSELIHRIEVP